MSSRQAVVFDPYDPATHADPYPIFERLRAEVPAYHNPVLGFWALSRYRDVFEAANDAATFSSTGRINLDDDDAPSIPLMIELDPPRHTELRSLVKRSFTPRRIAQMEDEIRSLTQELVAGIGAGASDVDFVDAFAGPLPVMVIAGLLGIPRNDWPKFKDWSDRLVSRTDDRRGVSADGLDAGWRLTAYFADVCETRREHPGDDLLSDLVGVNTAPNGISDIELLGFCLLLLLGGHETTTTLLCNSLRVLAAHPDQRVLLGEEPDRIPAAIEEVLRYDGPVLAMARTLTRDVDLHREHLPAGDRVLLLYGAANRDPDAFENPDVFDVTRAPDRHLGFGHGIHYCLGAALARLEARVALEELLPRMGGLEVDATGIERNVHVNIRSILRLPARIELHSTPA